MKKIFNLFLVALGVTGLTSCLDEEPFFNPEEVQNVIEFYSSNNLAPASTATAVYPMFRNSVEIAPEVDLPIVIKYAGPNVAPEDITVTVAIADAGIIEEYNEDQDEHFVLLPSEWYSMPTTTVTIPKGQREATLTIKVRSDMFDYDNSYALPLTITSASQGIISGNFNTAVFAIGPKNKYHGLYTNTFSRTRRDGSVIVSGTNTAELTTTGANSLLGNLIGYYSNLQYMSIDPATNKITVTSPGIAITEDVSYYDPATRIIHIQYVALNTVMKQTLVPRF
ncbi:DUF1735 domain-containing protein [Rufibacter roseus]|uniref:DUF1735 domain-containing protein n=1 Tax=Rufibacter roseus TaxID=1567108 RepID=A0ABW2DHM1_9BACT|nr:DUF1735 domain-containing protein [Rufibacter roseus]